MKKILVIVVLAVLLGCGSGTNYDPPTGRSWAVFDATCYQDGTVTFSGQVVKLQAGGTRTHIYDGDEQVGNIVFLPDNCVFIATGDKFTN